MTVGSKSIINTAARTLNLSTASVALTLTLMAASGSAWAQFPPGAGPGGDSGPKMLTPLPPPSPNSQKPSANPRNLDGTYVGSPFSGGGPPPRMSSVDPSIYTPRGAALAAKRMEMMKNNVSVETPSFRCRPFFNATNIAQPLFPVKIAQTKSRIVILTEEGRGVWEIFLDRGHAKKLMPTYNGESVGHWEADTLVVDTLGFNGKQWFDNATGPNSTDSHVTTRIKKIDAGNKLEFQVKVEDPQTFTVPQTRTFTLDWNPDLRMLEFACEESVDIGSYAGITAE